MVKISNYNIHHTVERDIIIMTKSESEESAKEKVLSLIDNIPQFTHIFINSMIIIQKLKYSLYAINF